jgi:hypothetical protein
VLAVPEFQRSYSWTTEEVQEFWSDLREARSLPSPEYFLGTIVISGRPGSRSTVIDGQQRLATVTMLLAAIRNQFLTAGDEGRAAVIDHDYIAARALRTADLEPRLGLNFEDAAFFRNLVVVRPGESHPNDEAGESHRRIRHAFEFLTKSVAQETDRAETNWRETLFGWVEFLERGVLTIVVDVHSEADAYLIFETLNDRGLPLNNADLLKNYLFGLADQDLPQVRDAWTSIVELISASSSESMIVTFLRHYWSSIRGATRERDLYRSIRREVVTAEHALELVSNLEQAANHYAALSRTDSDFWIEFGEDIFPTVETLQRLRLGQARPLLLAALADLPKAEVPRLLIALIGWSVRGFVVGGIGGGTTERYYCEAAVGIRQGKARVVAQVFDGLSQVIPNDETFEVEFSQESESRAWLARYYLLACEQFLEGLPTPSAVSESRDSQVTLGLILPRHPDSEELNFNDDEIPNWAYRLGNAALIRKEGIRDFNRASWPEKREILADSPFATSRLYVPKDWTPDAIRHRQLRIAELAKDVWPRRI